MPQLQPDPLTKPINKMQNSVTLSVTLAFNGEIDNESPDFLRTLSLNLRDAIETEHHNQHLVPYTSGLELRTVYVNVTEPTSSVGNQCSAIF